MANNEATPSDALAASSESRNDIASKVWDRIRNLMPDMSNLYLQPLDPSTDISLADRCSLIWQSTRPIGEFFDLSNFNLPPFEHISTRIGNNIETYFYNYFLLACLHLFLFSFAHFGSVFVLVCWLVLVLFMYVANDGSIDVAGRFEIGNNAKFGIALVTGIVAIFFGHVSTLIISLAVFLFVVVSIHGMLRDDTTDNAIADIAI